MGSCSRLFNTWCMLCRKTVMVQSSWDATRIALDQVVDPWFRYRVFSHASSLRQCSTAVFSLPPYSLTLPSSVRGQNIIITDVLMDILVNPVWKHSVHQVKKPKATTHASDTHPMSARRCLNFCRRTDCMMQEVCISLSCFVPPPYQKHWTPLVRPGSREVDTAGGKAKASWNGLVGLRGSSGWEFRGFFISTVSQRGPIKVKHKLPVCSGEIKIIPILSAWKRLTLKWCPWWEALRSAALSTIPILLQNEAKLESNAFW